MFIGLWKTRQKYGLGIWRLFGNQTQSKQFLRAKNCARRTKCDGLSRESQALSAQYSEAGSSVLTVGSGYDTGLAGKAFRAVPVTTDASGGDRVLEYQLLKSAAFKHDGVFIERTHTTRKLDAIQQVDSDVLVALQGIVKERFLNVADRHDPTPQSIRLAHPRSYPSARETK